LVRLEKPSQGAHAGEHADQGAWEEHRTRSSMEDVYICAQSTVKRGRRHRSILEPGLAFAQAQPNTPNACVTPTTINCSFMDCRVHYCCGPTYSTTPALQLLSPAAAVGREA
jgi:hypothetical protein